MRVVFELGNRGGCQGASGFLFFDLNSGISGISLHSPNRAGLSRFTFGQVNLRIIHYSPKKR